MYHFVPIICLIIFVLFLEIRLKRELTEVEEEFKALKKAILENREKILENKNIISGLNK
nr:MAG TPA: hypothetical protein [Caudoviricetes sp.]